MRKLYEVNTYEFFKFIRHSDAEKFAGSNERVFVDIDAKDRVIHYNYQDHPDFENGGTELTAELEQVKNFVERHGTELE